MPSVNKTGIWVKDTTRADILQLARIQLLLIPIFAFFKFIRPAILESKVPQWVKEISLSLPNFFQGFIGVLVLTGIGLFINDQFHKKSVQPMAIDILATIVAGIFVITQELNIYNLRGNNTFDPNDLIFSVIGLVVGFGVVIWVKTK